MLSFCICHKDVEERSVKVLSLIALALLAGY